MNEFQAMIEELNEIRPFKMYLHNCPTTTTTNIIHNGQNFGGMNKTNENNMRRNSISSTVVYGGTANGDIQAVLPRYEYHGNPHTLIMIMPDAIGVDNYIGSIEGQKDTGTNNNSHMYLDYSIIGYNKTVTNDPNTIASKYSLGGVHNSLFLGYYDKESNKFILNENCILLSENNASYTETIEKSRQIANENYQDRMYHRILIGDKDKRGFDEVMRQIDLRKAIIDNIPQEAIANFAKELYQNSNEGMYDATLDTEKLLVGKNSPSHLDTAMDTIIGMLPEGFENMSPEDQSNIAQNVMIEIAPTSTQEPEDDLLARMDKFLTEIDSNSNTDIMDDTDGLDNL